MTGGYYRTSSPVTALPMITRWIFDVPSKIVKLLEVRAVSAGRCPVGRRPVSTNSARGCLDRAHQRRRRRCRHVGVDGDRAIAGCRVRDPPNAGVGRLRTQEPKQLLPGAREV